MSKLDEIRAAQDPEATPTLADLIFALQNDDTPLAFSLTEVFALLPPSNAAQIVAMDANLEVTESHKGAIINNATGGNTLTINADAVVGWYVWVFVGLPTFAVSPVTVSAPAGADAPAEVNPGIYVLYRAADDETDPENPVRQYEILDVLNPAGFQQLDDVLEYANFGSLPAEGSSGIIYVTRDTNRQYRWDGFAYIRLGALVKSYADLASFPAGGAYHVGDIADVDAIYIAEDTGNIYRWDDVTGYEELAPVPQAGHVANADDTSLATLGGSIDAIRDALVAAGLMAAS